MTKTLKNISFLFCILLSISACQKGDVKQVLGINKNAPDEFRVLSRPSLSIPPDFNLAHPTAKKELQLSNKVRDDIRSTITGSSTKQTNAAKSTGESRLLNNANIKAQNSIRQTINEEYNVQKEEDNGFVGSIRSSITSIQGTTPKDVLDPSAERDRLNKDRNQKAIDSADSAPKE